MNRTIKRSDEGRALSRKLREWDPARERELKARDAQVMRAQLIAEDRRRAHTLSPRLMLAAATLVIAVLVGTLLVSRPRETPPTASAPSAETRLQVQLTGESGTRIFWTIEGQGDE
jgi:hypothetical protein